MYKIDYISYLSINKYWVIKGKYNKENFFLYCKCHDVYKLLFISPIFFIKYMIIN